MFSVPSGRRLAALLLLTAAALGLFGATACRKKKPASGQATPGFERRPYTAIPAPPTRTLKPGEPTPPPKLPE